MKANKSQQTSFREEPEGQEPSGRRRTGASKRVTESRAVGRRAQLDAEAEAREQGAARQGGKSATRRATVTLGRAIDDYLLDHEGGNHSPKTLEWHRTALGLMRSYFEKERHHTGRRGRGRRHHCLVRPHAQNPGQPWQGAQRAHHPDLCPLGARLLPLAGAARDD